MRQMDARKMSEIGKLKKSKPWEESERTFAVLGMELN
jgi:hypothetical protein